MSIVRVLGPFPAPVHGFSMMTARLADYLNRQGLEVIEHDLSSSNDSFFSHLFKSIKVLKACIAILVGTKADLSVGCNGGLGLLYNFLIIIVGRLRGCRIFLNHHSFGYIDSKSVLMQVICFSGGTPLTHVFLSKEMGEKFSQIYGSDIKKTVVPNALFVPSTQVKKLTNKGAYKVGLISNLCEDKGLYKFLDVAHEVARLGLEVEMHLAGPIATLKDEMNVRKAQECGKLVWHGPLYGEDKNQFFASLDLFLFPTLYKMEAQPTVIYEAFSYGVPVLAIERGAIKEQVGNCLDVVAENSFDSVALKKIVETQALNEKGRREIAKMASRRYEEGVVLGEKAIKEMYFL